MTGTTPKRSCIGAGPPTPAAPAKALLGTTSTRRAVGLAAGTQVPPILDVGEGATMPPPCAMRTGTGWATSPGATRRLKGMPKLSALRRINTDGDIPAEKGISGTACMGGGVRICSLMTATGEALGKKGLP
eukprot:CAMPEP_0183571890 /NCGR_PEP_ID=MMETSP0371-20130417/127210_1 /TAXON_ID=268820 /ORGANISM="Peridinium aciculiferum, Strain PAER-2" /LENGTH=130 /DNA_ID=CAMNT_0025781693 /DNA_START=93 /DNA_END=482 /DNA_ORIENTATION=+